MAKEVTDNKSTQKIDVVANSCCVFLYQGQDLKENQVLAYIAVPDVQMKDFLYAARKTADFRISDYGRVIASGRGIPSDEAKKYVEEVTGLSAEKFSVIE